MSATVRISILIATRERPRMLARLLEGLRVLQIDDAHDLEIVVIDNDPKGSSRDTCEHLRASLPWPLVYEIEPRAGIPFARNRAIASIRRGTAFIAFIDDDEIPDPTWLAALLRVQHQHSADMVAGPVLSILPSDAPSWATQGRIFAHPPHRTGDRLESTSTANVLIAAHVLDAFAGDSEPWFDERLALTGGSDRHFFLRAHERGFSLIWAQEALVREEIPESRAKLPWVMKRMYRQGICNAFCEIDIERMKLPRAQMAVRGAAFIAGGVALLPLGAVTGSHRLVHYARYVAYGAGMLQAVRGHFYDEYTRVHGQ